MAKPVILVVENNQEVLKQIKHDLERRYGKRYRVFIANSAGEALETLRGLNEQDAPVALVLADQKLPDISGVGFLKQANALYPQAKRGLLTTFNDTDAAIEAIEGSKIDDYLVKPCQPAEQNLYPSLKGQLSITKGA